MTDIDRLYPPSYYRLHYRTDPRREAMYRQERDRILRRVRASGRILDVGCAVGGFLDCFDDHWEKWGIEPATYAAHRCIEKGIRLIDPPIEPTGYWDVIVFRGSLQHVDRPLPYLAEAREALRPGGLLAILATPNTHSLPYRLFRRLPALDPPRNFFVPSDAMLINALRNLRFRVLDVRYPYWGTPYASPARDALRFAMALAGFYRPFAWPGNMMEIYASV